MPTLSHTGRLTLASGIALTVGGMLGGIEPLLGAGPGVLVGVALAWVATIPLPRRMRRERLEFTWWLAHRSGVPRKPDEPVVVRIALRNPTDEPWILSTPRLALSPGVRHARWKGRRIELPPKALVTFDLEVRPSHAGRHVLHGAWMTLSGPLGLAWAPLYFPNPLMIEVQPRAAGIARVRVSPREGATARAGRSVRRAGEGPEVRELREHQPGDPFRRIAWKASARRGRLLVRETEDDAQVSRYILLDASATMRGDDRGRARLDYGIELVAQAAKSTLAAGDRLGLVGFDSRVLTHVPADAGPMQGRLLVSAAVELRSLVDEDLTDLDDEGLLLTVARYFREQEGIDVPVNAGVESRTRLAELASKALRNDPLSRLPVRARDPLSELLRRFCRARAIPLPLKHDATGRAKANGLAKALERAIDGAREARTLLVISDLDPLTELSALKHALGLARQRHHRVTFIAPSGEDFLKSTRSEENAPEQPPAEQSTSLHSLLLQDELTRLKELRTELAKMGVPLFLARASDTAAHWLRRAAAPRAGRVR